MEGNFFSKNWKWIVPVAVSLILWFIPAPEGCSENGWHYFAVFLGIILGLIFEPLPGAVVGLIGVSLLAWLRIGADGSSEKLATTGKSISWALSGFSNTTIWLIFAAFMLGLGYSKTGLGRRIALFLVSKLGKTSLGLGYAVALSDGILAPFIPSNSARSGGVIYPIVSNIPPMVDSYPDKNPRKLGAYLYWVALAATCVTSTLFLTGLAPNLLAISTAKEAGFVGIEWMDWFKVIAPCGILLFILTPWLAYVLYPPETKGSQEAVDWAKEELKKMGSVTLKEWMMLGVALFCLLLWIFGGKIVNATTVALTAIVLMIILKIIDWNDVLSNKAAWNVLVWFSTLVALASGLKNSGFLAYVGTLSETALAGLSPSVAFIGLLVIFYMLHYFFASTTAHVSALLVLFITVASKINGIDVQLATLLMIQSLGIMGILTPYGTGPSPIWYGAGFIKASDFWRLAFIFGMIYLIAFLVITIPWIKIIGFTMG